MHIHISTQSGTPLYQQIIRQIKYLVASGKLAPGEEIPPIRELAEQLMINPNTVARAYLELERAGLVIMRPGSGTHVSDAGSPLARRQRLKILTEQVDGLLAEARHLDIGLDEVIAMLRERHDAMEAAR
jgi:GntR family transcriptional regulator